MSVVTFEDAPPPGTINLGVGQPSADLLPVDLLRQASDAFFKDADPFELNYGSTAGDPRFLKTLAGFLSEAYAADVREQELFLSGGNSQALDLAALTFAKPGDTVFVEEPSYFLAFRILRDHGLNVVGLPMDDEGVSIEALGQALQSHTPAFLYTIPGFHNPLGQSSSAARRTEILKLAEKYDFFIVADEVYQLLHYYDAPPPAYGTLTASERVISLGSFSKILAPAMRLGWIQTSPALRQRLSANGFVNSGGSINHYGSHLVRKTIELGLLQQHVKRLRQAYRQRVEAMDAALHEHFDGIAEWTRPTGGYFFWLRFAESVDTAALRDKARELQTGFQPGSVFSSTGQMKNFMRLSFAHYDTNDIQEGVARLRRVLD
tara:strand:- start:3077 stop:4207 length:1131 start_codon:yes stop_codon:yes gene_type:complete